VDSDAASKYACPENCDERRLPPARLERSDGAALRLSERAALLAVLLLSLALWAVIWAAVQALAPTQS
jgi:hypothetical protein